MLNGLFAIVLIQFFIKVGSYFYKQKVERKFEYKIPTRGFFGSLVDRTTFLNDKEAVQNSALVKEVNHLFYGELAGVFLMIIAAIVFILVEP